MLQFSRSSCSSSVASGDSSARSARGTEAYQFWAASLFLSLAAVACLLLVSRHFADISLPGCGLQSACDRAADSRWGRLPIVDWPLPLVGLAWFFALLGTWILTQGRLDRALRWLIRCSVVASIGLIAVMLKEGYVCLWCLLIHISNFGFAAIVERSRCERFHRWRSVAWFIPIFALAIFVLALVETQHLRAAARDQETERFKSGLQIVEQGVVASTASSFTGRYQQGPTAATIRIVVFGDYQCPDCMRIEEQVQQVLRTRNDVSFSFRHYPLCLDCNQDMRRQAVNLHPNACRAACAAEAAGALGGDRAFFAMHDWLFSRKGQVTGVEDVRSIVRELGLDYGQFVRIMNADTTFRLIQEDVEEAGRLGILSTPMVFINGVEMKGIGSHDALRKTIQWVEAAVPPAAAAEHDRPPTAAEKYLADWRDGQPFANLKMDSTHCPLGSTDPDVDIVVWGDYLEPETAKLDGLVRAAIAKMPEARYSFRHFVIGAEIHADDWNSNPKSEQPGVDVSADSSLSFLAAQAVEAGGRFGGPAGFWAMHIWVLDHQHSFDRDLLTAQLKSIGIDPQRFVAEMESPGVNQAIVDDMKVATSLKLPYLPLIFVNGKWVPRWQLEGTRILERILRVAADEMKQQRERPSL